jgi:phosphoribosyl 1,2-cyclic phosphodiesterase
MPGEEFRLQVQFWGVRGSTPTPHAENLGFGGNTSCLEISTGNGERIIIDAGTGIRRLGRHLVEQGQAKSVNLFFTHFHWDHIQGIPFFAPLLQPGNKVTFHSFPKPEEIRERLERQMSSPYFTLDFNAVGAAREYSQIEGVFHEGELAVTPFPLNHPQGASGYRVEAQGASIVIATDLEHGDSALDKVLREYAEGADLLIYDAQYTPAEYVTRQGWGHSTYSEAARVASDARVSQLVLFHHDPTHDDDQLAGMVKIAGSEFENTVAARELHSIRLI